MNFIYMIIFQVYIFRINTSIKRLLKIFILQIFTKLFLKNNNWSQIALDLIKISIDHWFSNLSINCFGSIGFDHCFQKIYTIIAFRLEKILNLCNIIIILFYLKKLLNLTKMLMSLSNFFHFIQNRNSIRFDLLWVNLKHHVKSHLFVINYKFLISVQIKFELHNKNISWLKILLD